MDPSLRLTGLTSGMDIDSTVAKLMNAHRIPLNKLNQSKQTMEWQRDDYRAMNSKLLELRNKAFDMKLTSNYQTKKADISNTDYFSATATASATEGVYSLKVTQLATAASITSGDVVTGAAGDSTKTMANLGLAAGATLNVSGEKGSISIAVNTTDTIADLVRNINNKSAVSGVRVSYDQNMDRFFFVSSTTGESSKVDLKSNDTSLLSSVLKITSASVPAASANTLTGTASFSNGTSSVINSALTANQTFRISHTAGGTTTTHDFTITSTTTMAQLIDTINSSDLGKKGVSAFLNGSGNLAFFNPDQSNTMTFSDETSDASDIISTLGLSAPSTSASFSYQQVSTLGQNATVKYNGVTGSYTSNTFSINGVNITAKKVQNADDTIDPPVSMNVTRDIEGTFNSIKSFVEKYNETIDVVNKKLTEERFRKFDPLTDEQKKDMTEDQIKKWEEKAKSGLIRGDSTLSSAMTKMRLALSSVISGLPSGDLKTLESIGISTSNVNNGSLSGNFSERGKLYINEAKLRTAIAEKPDQVQQLFIADDNVTDSDTGDGVVTRIYDKLTTVMAQIRTKAGSSLSTTLDSYDLGKKMKQADKQIENLQRRLDDLQTKYYKQFQQMETAMNKLNSQSAYLAQQMGAGA